MRERNICIMFVSLCVPEVLSEISLFLYRASKQAWNSQPLQITKMFSRRLCHPPHLQHVLCLYGYPRLLRCSALQGLFTLIGKIDELNGVVIVSFPF